MPRAKKSPSSAKPRRASKKKRSLADLPPQPDPRAPLDSALLIGALQPVRKQLEEDLLTRAKTSPAITLALSARHAEEKKADRTADAYPVWQRRFVEQVAAAWILSCVFVRTLEDRGLLEHARIAGPGAMDAQRTFLQLAPSLSEREYLLTVFREMTRLPAAAALFDAHDPVWMLAPSAEGAKALLQLFRAGSDEAPSLRFGQADTRFLGDLYQDLNESVRERYALLQTPDFVESFILDRTLEPAIEKFGLSETDLIDPTCGSGHFLLGAFDRLFEHHRRAEPGLDVREAARRALDKIAGADINPYAVAIAKFRLTLSYLEKAGYAKLSEAPRLPLHLAVADSLLYNPQHAQGSLFHIEGAEAAKWEKRAFDFEDEDEARDVLHKQYAAVVGNPPYITVKDKALRESYRKLYASAAMSYALSAPFTERFFQLARRGGCAGMITANSFMKREFGKKLIEGYLPTINLDLIVNTSGAYIPGHGTPTVLLFGSHEAPRGSAVLAVLAKRGEPTTPEDPARGQVWSSIAQHFGEVGFENDYISVAEVERASLARHPWSLAGGGAAQLKELLESRAKSRLADIVELIGFGAVTREDEVFAVPMGTGERWRIDPSCVLPYGNGERVRDWTLTHAADIVFPYGQDGTVPLARLGRWGEVLWQYRTQLWLRQGKGFKTKRDAGGEYYEYSMFYPDRHFACYRIAFAFVATHNHFVLDRGGSVFNRSAPIIKLPETATEEDHLALLAYLNSSTACFWMKQVFFDKGNRGEGGGTTAEAWEKFFEFDGTKLKACPLPAWKAVDRAQAISLARALTDTASERQRAADLTQVFESATTLHDLINDVEARLARIDELEGMLRSTQEQLDWLAYRAFGMTEHVPAIPERIAPGARASDIRFAREVAAGEVGRRYFELCRLPPAEALVASEHARSPHVVEALGAIDASAVIALIESPTYKRTYREGLRPVDAAGQARDWIAARIERYFEAEPILASALAGKVCDDPNAAAVLEYLEQGAAARVFGGILRDWSVPFASAHRYTSKGLEKRAAWERTWDLQRREDAGEKAGAIPVPPKYDQKDFQDPNYYRLRGKLDVPKERFISYPGCESDEDGEPLYGWAGWDHAQRAAALVALYNDRKTRESWSKERLVPMLAGVLELLPWLKQWHSEPMPDYDTTVAEAYEAFLDNELRDLAVTRADLAAWQPGQRKPRQEHYTGTALNDHRGPSSG